MWALHKVHDYNFSRKQKNEDENRQDKSDKSVSFSAETKQEDGGASPSIKVNKELLSNAKAYLAKYKDFQ